MVFTFCILLSLSSQAFAIQVEIPSEPIEEVESVVTVNDLGSEGDFVGCFEPIIIRLPIDDQAAPASETSTTRDYVEFSIRAGIKKSDGKNYTWVYNVDCDALIKPSIDVTAELYGEFTDGSGTFEEIATDNISINTNIGYGFDHTFKTTAKTGYYKMKFKIVAENQTVRNNTLAELYNRSGNVWYETFSATGKTLPKPRADWKKETLYERPSNLADNYYKQYTQRTGIELDQDLYDVHHIQPLFLGGNNTYNNLIHLPKEKHKTVTAWFRGY